MALPTGLSARIDSFIETFSQKVERSETIQTPEEVIVFTFENIDNECPGMLPEDKVRLRLDNENDLFIPDGVLGLTRK